MLSLTVEMRIVYSEEFFVYIREAVHHTATEQLFTVKWHAGRIITF